MQLRPDPLKGAAADLPRISQPASLTILAAMWGALSLYDLVAGGMGRAPADYDAIRLVLPLIGLIPAFLRLLNPSDLRDDDEAYVTFVRVSTLATIVALISIIVGILPIEYTDEAVAAGTWSFIAGRGAALVLLLMMPPVAEAMIRLLRYRARLSVPRLAPWVVYFVGIGVVFAQVFPGSAVVAHEPGPSALFGSLAGLSAMVLSLRSRWLVNLRKRRKLNVLGLSFVGMIASATLIGMSTENAVAPALSSLFPGLSTLVFALGLSLELTYCVLFVKALVVLPTAETIDRRNTEVSSLATFGRLLTRSFDLRDLVDTAIAVTCDVTAGQAAWIELGDGSNGCEILCGSAPAVPEAAARRLMRSPVRGGPLCEVVRTKRTVQVANHIEAPLATAGEPVALIQPGSIAATPLRSGSATIGTLYVAKERNSEFDREDLVILQAVADQIALSVEHSRLISNSIERERFEQEMLIARDLQERLLPRAMPLSKIYQLDAESRPAELVGGDYYDLVSFKDGTLGIVIGDVSGKGASAALYMGMIKGVIQALAGSTADPRELLSKINVALHGHIDQRWFATMTCAQILEDKRVLRIARAGHCPTLIVRNGIGAYHRSRGLGLALARPLMFERILDLEEVHFCADDYVVFLSDGLPEARSPEGEEYGYDRLLSAVTSSVAGVPTASELRTRIFTELAAFTRGEPPIDDTTLVVLRWKPSGGPSN